MKKGLSMSSSGSASAARSLECLLVHLTVLQLIQHSLVCPLLLLQCSLTLGQLLFRGLQVLFHLPQLDRSEVELLLRLLLEVASSTLLSC